MPSGIQSHVWLGPETLCLGLGEHYAFFDTRSISLELYKVPSLLPRSTDPLLVAASSSQIALTRKGGHYLFLDEVDDI